MVGVMRYCTAGDISSLIARNVNRPCSQRLECGQAGQRDVIALQQHRDQRARGPEGCYYSHDALNWQHSAGPAPANYSNLSLNDGHLSYQDIVYFNGMWLWNATKYRRYSYVERGIFSDTTKSGSYAQTLAFCGADLAGPWEP
jgi:hypothetical protein